MNDFDFIFYSPVDGGGNDPDARVDLDKVATPVDEPDEDDDEPEGDEPPAKKKGDLKPEDVDAWLKANGYVAHDVNDPRVKKMYEADQKAEADKRAKDDEELDDLLVKDPKKYAAEVRRRTSEQMREERAEETKLQNVLLKNVRTAVPELDDEAYERIAEEVAGASLDDLRAWKAKGSLITAAKAAAFDVVKAGGPKRAANTNTDGAGRGAGGGSGTSVPSGIQGKLGLLGNALRNAGIQIKDEDIAASDYMPKRKR